MMESEPAVPGSRKKLLRNVGCSVVIEGNSLASEKGFCAAFSL